ncbi:hypothetical protein GCM10009740_26160 [Terrabacter terrae]|uniref:Uncharacterized protein n=1 Tax=Terrabacter terrae TaxID=318434 RepID=A0ABN2UCS1_9MICO
MDHNPADVPAQDQELVCFVCGAVAPADQRAVARLTWSRGRDGERTTWTCDRCSRDNVRSIEGKLDPAWW